MVKRVNNYIWQGTAHEYIGYISDCIFSDIHIWRKEKQNDFLQAKRLKINKELISNQISLLPRSLFYYTKEVRDFFVRLQEKTAYYVTEMLKMRNSN